MEKNIPRYQCILVVTLTIISLLFNIAILKNPVYYGLFIGLLSAIAILLFNKYTAKEIAQMMKQGVMKNSKVLIVLMFVGMLIGIWKINGVIPTMIYYGLAILNPKIYLLSVFTICGFISMILGTAVGTVSTVGIVLIGIGTSMGIPPAIIAGAVVSGSFLGDRSSPISSTLNLISGVTETNLNNNFRYLFTTMLPGILAAMTFYYFIGLRYSNFKIDQNKIILFKNVLEKYYIISPWLLLPPIIIVLFALLKIPTLYNMGLAVVIGIVFGFFIQEISFLDSLKAALLGFYPSVPKDYYVSLSGGGLYSFKTMLIVLLSATSLNGIFEGTNMIFKMIEPIIVKLKDKRNILIFTVLLSILVAMLACNQIISVIIPAGLLLKIYKDNNIDNKLLARTLSDSGVIFSSIIPWNVAALTPASVMGIGVIEYLPYSFLSYSMPIITLLAILVFTKGSGYDRKAHCNLKC